ncbi:MAG: signal peptidase I [Balneola sp.]|nr:signal peptidase I [Balneola sp.]|tara:strand:- start:49477 stop:49941 length:465 start_codon:yes stop_codon:yes gene_type:complete
MLDSIADGTYVVVDKSYFGNKKHDFKDIIIVKNPSNISFVKRVIGQERDILKISDQGIIKGDYFIPHDPIFFSIKNDLVSEVAACIEYANILYRNVEEVESIFEFVSENNSVCTMHIPKGYYFVVGDNPFESMDSRFWGFIDETQIVGKVIAVF